MEREPIIEQRERRENVEFKIGQTSLDIVVVKRKSAPNELIVESLALRNDKGEVKSLMEFLPEGWRLMLYPMPELQAKADFADRTIKLPMEYMRENRWRIAQGEQPPEDVNLKQETVFGPGYYDRKFLRSLREVRELKRLPIFQDNPGAILTLLHEIGHSRHPNHKDLPEDFHERVQELYRRQGTSTEKIPEERDAWAFAIRTIKQLQNSGFDFGNAFSREKILKHIEYPLISHGDPKKLGRQKSL